MSVIFFGVRRYGRVDDVPGAYISTTFGYLQFVPVLPRSSYVFVGPPGAAELAFEIPVHWRSVAAGLLRVWGPLLVVICGASFQANRPVAMAGIAFGLAATAWAWLVAPRVRERERLMRNVYSRWVGCPVDVAVLGSAMNTTATRLRAAMGEWAEPFVPTDYREQKKTDLAYRDIALDPRMDDRRFLAAAITLCRIEEADAPLRERAKLAACRNRIFDRLATLHPEGTQEPPTVDVMWDHHVVLAAREAGVDLSPAPAPPALPPEVVANRKRRDKIIGIVAVAGFAACAVAYAGWLGWAATHPTLYVWNDLATADITIEVDGEPATTVAGASRGELRLAVGSHHLRAVRQPNGDVVEETAVDVARSKPWFWAPATRGRVCFFVDEAHYGPRNAEPPPPRFLDPTRTVWQLDTPVDYILEEPPSSLQLKQGEHVVKRALTGVPCEAIEADPSGG